MMKPKPVLIIKHFQVHSESHGKIVPFQIQGGWVERLCSAAFILHGNILIDSNLQSLFPLLPLPPPTLPVLLVCPGRWTAEATGGFFRRKGNSYRREALKEVPPWDRRDMAPSGRCSQGTFFP